MTATNIPKVDNSPAIVQQNWPLVGTLFALTAIPGIPAILIVLLALIGPIDSPVLMSFINASYFESPLAVLLHGSSGIAFFLSVPLQFSPAFRQIAAHRRWMYRAVAISLAAVTPLFIEVVAVLTLGQIEAFKPFLAQLLHDYGRLIALCFNLLIAQLLLQKPHKRATLGL